MKEKVIVVNREGQMTGTMDKMAAHRHGILHRAFSVFIFNFKGELLLQQRSSAKYHSGGLWTNTCCSHPKLGEFTDDAAHRRLMEEMGMQSELAHVFNFTYHANVDNGLIEHEFDHVFFGFSDEAPAPNPDEVMNYKYLSVEALAAAMNDNPDEYTEWLKICFNKVSEKYDAILKPYDTLVN